MDGQAFLTLGLFDFGSLLLWRDLDPANWPRSGAREPAIAAAADRGQAASSHCRAGRAAG